MSSSNRHWPSMFRSKPCGNQLQNDSAISPNCHSKPSSTPYSSGLEERSPEPKPRWNPKPEQIRILEAIFYSGMVNPPREEIRKIRVQLQEFGQVGDANVFYWFQNRKSRSKNKLRSSAAAARHNPPPPPPPPPQPPPLITTTTTTTTTTPTSSSSSSSEKSSAGSQNTLQAIHSQPPTATTSLMNGQTYLPPDLSGIGDHFLNLQNFVGFPDHGTTLNPTTLWGELLGQTPSKTVRLDHLIYGTGTSTSAAAAAAATTTTTANPINEIQGGGGSSGRSTVFINEVAFEMVAGMPLNVKEAFGGTALLLDHSGRPVITDEWGITIHPLQHGASYYVV